MDQNTPVEEEEVGREIEQDRRRKGRTLERERIELTSSYVNDSDIVNN